MGKTLWTDSVKGPPIVVYCAINEIDEAYFVVRKIKEYHAKGGNLSAVGVLYRSNAQSRILEEAFVKNKLAYNVYGGLRFFERAEIKDALAYLRLVMNHHDNVAFERILNVPARGIGERSLAKLREQAKNQSTSLWNAAQQAIKTDILPSKVTSSLVNFIKMIEKLALDVTRLSISVLVDKVIKISGLLRYFKQQRGEHAQIRVENLEELVNATADFAYNDNKEQQLIEFLAYTTLDAGEKQVDNKKPSVQLMTLHAAKGLEFAEVFICGVEENLFPHRLCVEDTLSLEEERRLCYVGITRAKQQLYICHARVRRMYGREEHRYISRFVREIPNDLIKEERADLVVVRVSNSEGN